MPKSFKSHLETINISEKFGEIPLFAIINFNHDAKSSWLTFYLTIGLGVQQFANNFQSFRNFRGFKLKKRVTEVTTEVIIYKTR